MNELERFKCEIDLVFYAMSQGYEIDRRKSSRHSVCLRGPHGKIVVGRDSDGHWIWFSVGGETKGGTIIDFVQLVHPDMTIGHVRRHLRSWRPGAAPSSTHQIPERTPRDRWAILKAYERCVELPDKGHPYLVRRGIPIRIQLDERFRPVIRQDARAVIFPHYDDQGVCGYEVVADGYKGFCRGGRKGLWISVGAGDATKIVVCESVIDSLSHAAMYDGCGYVALGGAVSVRQLDLLRRLVEALPREVVVAIGTDADEAGDRTAEQIMALVPGRAERERPPAPSKDWNEVLCGSKSSQTHDLRRPYPSPEP
jgi:hypothetical protein